LPAVVVVHFLRRKWIIQAYRLSTRQVKGVNFLVANINVANKLEGKPKVKNKG